MATHIQIHAETKIDTDTDHIKGAKELIDMILSYDEAYYDMDQDALAQIVRASGKALYNQFCFALDRQPEGDYWVITPKAFFEENGYMYDGHLPFELENFFEESEGTFSTAYTSAEDAAKALIDTGLTYSSEFQDFINPDVTISITASEREAKTSPACSQKPKPPCL